MKLVIGKYSDVVVIFSSWVATSQLTIDPDTNKLYCGNCFQINSGNASDIDNDINSKRNVIRWIKILCLITIICYRVCGEFDDRYKCDTKEKLAVGDSICQISAIGQ